MAQRLLYMLPFIAKKTLRHRKETQSSELQGENTKKTKKQMSDPEDLVSGVQVRDDVHR
jgi:hypothetical protein